MCFLLQNKVFTEFIYERERGRYLFFDTRLRNSESFDAPPPFFFFFFSCVECLARRIRQTPSSAASLPVFIWKQMNWICCFLVLTSLQKKYINKYLKKKKILVTIFLFKTSHKSCLSCLECLWDGTPLIHSLQ